MTAVVLVYLRPATDGCQRGLWGAAGHRYAWRHCSGRRAGRAGRAHALLRRCRAVGWAVPSGSAARGSPGVVHAQAHPISARGYLLQLGRRDVAALVDLELRGRGARIDWRRAQGLELRRAALLKNHMHCLRPLSCAGW